MKIQRSNNPAEAKPAAPAEAKPEAKASEAKPVSASVVTERPSIANPALAFQDRAVTMARPGLRPTESLRTTEDTLALVKDARRARFDARATVAPEASPEAAARTAAELRSSSDADKLVLLDRLESMGRAGHAGWEAVYHQSSVVENLAKAVKETYDPKFEARASAFLCKVYRDHFQDDGPHSAYLKSTVTEGLVNTYGADVLKVALQHTGSDEIAEAMVNRAQWQMDHPLIRASKGTPILEEMGISGANQKVLVVDSAGSDHMAHTSYLANPSRSGSKLMSYGATEMSGPASVTQVKEALAQAQAMGVNVVSMSIGFGWGGEDQRLYTEAAGGDAKKARQMFDKDVADLRRVMDKFPGIIVVAAGNSGPNSEANDLAKSSKVIVAGALDRTETQVADFTSPAHHPSNMLGVGTAVLAPGQDGNMRFLENATSWAAPQIAHFAACVYQGGQQFNQSISAQEVRDILKKTSEPLPGQAFPRADVVTAVRYAKTLSYVKSTGDAALRKSLEGLTPARARELANQIEPMLHNLGPNSQAQIAALIRG